MPVSTPALKKPVNLSLNDELVSKSRAYCCKPSAKLEEILQATAEAERLARQSNRQQVHQAVHHWEALHDAAGSYADGHSSV